MQVAFEYSADYSVNFQIAVIYIMDNILTGLIALEFVADYSLSWKGVVKYVVDYSVSGQFAVIYSGFYCNCEMCVKILYLYIV